MRASTHPNDTDIYILLLRCLDETFHRVHSLQFHTKGLCNNRAQSNMRVFIRWKQHPTWNQKFSKLLRWLILDNISQEIYIKYSWTKCRRFSSNVPSSDTLPRARNIALLWVDEFYSYAHAYYRNPLAPQFLGLSDLLFQLNVHLFMKKVNEKYS